MSGDRLRDFGITSPQQWFCPICGKVIIKAERFCEECKSEAREMVGKAIDDFQGRLGAFPYETAGLVAMVAKEIEDAEREKAIRQFEKIRKEKSNV